MNLEEQPFLMVQQQEHHLPLACGRVEGRGDACPEPVHPMYLAGRDTWSKPRHQWHSCASRWFSFPSAFDMVVTRRGGGG